MMPMMPMSPFDLAVLNGLAYSDRGRRRRTQDFQVPPAPDEDALRPPVSPAYQPLPQDNPRYLMRQPGGGAVMDDGGGRQAWNARGQALYSGPSRDYTPYSGAHVPYTDTPKDITLRVEGFGRRGYTPFKLPPPDGKAHLVEYDDQAQPVAIDTPLTFRTLPKPDALDERMQNLMRGASLKDLMDYQQGQEQTRIRAQEAQTNAEEAKGRNAYYAAQAKNLGELTEATKEQRLAEAKSKGAYAENMGNRADDTLFRMKYGAALDAYNTAALELAKATDDDAKNAAQKAMELAQQRIQSIESSIATPAARGGSDPRKDQNWQKLRKAFPGLPDSAIDAKYQRFVSMQ